VTFCYLLLEIRFAGWNLLPWLFVEEELLTTLFTAATESCVFVVGISVKKSVNDWF